MALTKMVDGRIVVTDAADVAQPGPASSPVSQVARAQAKIALRRAGLLPAVEAAVSAAGGETAIWYADAATWRRDHPVLVTLGESLNLTSDQIDALFTQAAAIEA